MRILHSSDWHLGRFLNSFSLIEDQAYFLNWLLKVLKSEKIDLLIVAGDIYNTTTPSVDAVSLLDEFLTKVILELKIKVCLISGNHDSACKLSFSSKILQRCGLFVAGGLGGMERLNFSFSGERVQVFLLPFFNLVEAKEFANVGRMKNFDQSQLLDFILTKSGLNVPVDCFRLLCAHGLYVNSGGNLKFCDSELVVGGSEAFNLEVFKEVDYFALGHLHGPQKVGSNGFYCGSPLKYSTSEANHKKRVLIVDVESKTRFSVESIFVEPLHDLKILEGSFSELMNQTSNDYVSLRITDSNFIMNSYVRLQSRFVNMLELRFVNLNFEVPTELKSQQLKKPEDLFFNFYEDVVGRKMNKIESKIFLEVVEGLKLNEDDKA